jgi:GGDEF domain-containing protein
MEVCRRILRMLDSAVEFQTTGVTASIGVVVDQTAKLDIEQLLEQADAEMYRVKQAAKRVARAVDAAATYGSDLVKRTLR